MRGLKCTPFWGAPSLIKAGVRGRQVGMSIAELSPRDCTALGVPKGDDLLALHIISATNASEGRPQLYGLWAKQKGKPRGKMENPF